MTDEQRLGLPEEPDFYADKCGTRCNTDAAQCSYDFDRCAEYHDAKAWGAAWREKALELEKRAVNAEAGDVPETDFGNSVEEIPHDPR